MLRIVVLKFLVQNTSCLSLDFWAASSQEGAVIICKRSSAACTMSDQDCLLPATSAGLLAVRRWLKQKDNATFSTMPSI